jgi:hypothetical protein
MGGSCTCCTGASPRCHCVPRGLPFASSSTWRTRTVPSFRSAIPETSATGVALFQCQYCDSDHVDSDAIYDVFLVGDSCACVRRVIEACMAAESPTLATLIVASESVVASMVMSSIDDGWPIYGGGGNCAQLTCSCNVVDRVHMAGDPSNCMVYARRLSTPLPVLRFRISSIPLSL